MQTFNGFIRKPNLILLAFRGLSWVLAGVILILAFIDPRFRDSEGFLTGAVCLPIAASLALFVLGWGITNQYRAFASWVSLALVGQAVMLQTINAGPLLHYQHYRSLSEILFSQPWLVVFLALQTILVMIGLFPRWKNLSNWIRKNFKIWQLMLIGLIFFFTSASLSESPAYWLYELVFATLLQALNLATVVLAVISLPEAAYTSLNQHFKSFFGIQSAATTDQPRIDRFALVAVIWVILLAALLNILSYEQHPHVRDELGYLYQARFLAHSRLTMPAPPVPQAFDFYLMQFDGDRWFPVMPIGWAAILSVGTRLGAPWLVNPLLNGINILLTYLLLTELYSRRLARIAVVLLCCSPWFVFMGMNFMTHTFMLTCALGAAVCLAWSRKSGKAWWALLAGFALGMMSLIRPLDAAMIGALLGLWAVGVGGKRLRFSAIGAFILGTLMVGSVTFPYNKALTGDPLTFPLNIYLDQEFGKNSNSYGFGPDQGMGWALDPNPGHSPIDGMINGALNAFSLNIELFGWSAGSLLLISLFLVSGNYKKSDYLMITVILVVFIAYFFYYYSGGPDFGARYWYLMIVPLVALSVRGVEFLESRLEPGPRVNLVLTGVLLLSLSALVIYIPWRAIDKYHHYDLMRPDVRQLAKEYSFGRALVLVRGEEHPDYASAAAYNPLDVYADAPIYVYDRNEVARRQVIEAYSDRPVWILNGPTLTGRGYQVIAGPLSAEKALLLKNNVP